MPSTKITEYDMEDSVFESILTKLEELETKLDNTSSGVVRHIQRGTFVCQANGNGPTEITLTGFTNLNKMSVRLHGASYSAGGSDASFAVLPYVSSLTLNKLVLDDSTNTSYGANCTCSYEVIEFY